MIAAYHKTQMWSKTINPLYAVPNLFKTRTTEQDIKIQI